MSIRLSRLPLPEIAAGLLLSVASDSTAQVCPAAGPTGPVEAPVFVRNLSGQTSWFAAPVVADLDGDGAAELVAATYDVDVFSGDGTLLDRADDGSGRVYAPHVVADLDGDGTTEVVAGRGHQVWVWEWTGSALAVKSGWPADTTTGGNPPEVRGMASGDLDRDGTLEIVVTTTQTVPTAEGGAQVFVLAADGSPWVGNRLTWGQFIRWADADIERDHYHLHTGAWPHPSWAEWLQWTASPPSVADLDLDGRAEVIGVPNVEMEVPYVTQAHGIMVLEGAHGDGSRSARRLPRWETLPRGDPPIIVDGWYPPTGVPAPTIVNLVGDSNPEIVVSLNDGYVTVYDHTGQRLWRTDTRHGLAISFNSETTVADLNRDGAPELLVATFGDPDVQSSGFLMILSAATGAVLHDVPLPDPGHNGNGNGAPAAPAVGDLDGDGRLEIVVQTFDHGIDVFTVPGSADSCVMWPTARGGPTRSGQADRRWLDGIFLDGFESGDTSRWSTTSPSSSRCPASVVPDSEAVAAGSDFSAASCRARPGRPAVFGREIDTESADLPVQGGAVDAELARGRGAVPPIARQNHLDEASLEVVQVGCRPVVVVPIEEPVREIGLVDPSALTHDIAMLDGILELADVARIVVAHQSAEGCPGETLHHLATSHRETPERCLGERRDIRLAIAERRHHQPDDVDAVVEVLAERPVVDHGREITIGRGHDPNVRRPRDDVTEWLVLPLLQQPQELDLDRGRQVADFVDEQGSALGRLHPPGLVPVGAGERAFAVAEKLRLEKRLRQGGAIDRDHGSVALIARPVDGVGQQPLARSALPLDQHGALALGDGRHHVEQLLDTSVGGNDGATTCKLLDVRQQTAHLVEIAEGLDAAHDLAFPVAKQRGRHRDGDASTGGVPDLNREVDDGPAGLHGVPQRAGLGADVGPEDLAAPLIQGLLAGHAERPLGSSVEARDPPLPIDREDPVRNAVEHRFESIVAALVAAGWERAASARRIFGHDGQPSGRVDRELLQKRYSTSR